MEAVVRTTFRVTAVLTRIAAAHDLSLTQLRVLGILRDRPARMTELAAFLGLDKSTMSGLVERAERRGLMVRGRSPEDRRAVDVALTEQGRELFDKVRRDVVAELAPFVGRLDEAQQCDLTRLLDVLTAADRAGVEFASEP